MKNMLLAQLEEQQFNSIKATLDDLVKEKEMVADSFQHSLRKIESPLVEYPGAPKRLSRLVESVLLDVRKLFEKDKQLDVYDVPDTYGAESDNCVTNPGFFYRERCQAHPCDLLESGPLLGEVLLEAVAERLPCLAETREFELVARAIQRSIGARIACAVAGYVEYLQEELRKSHLQERRRISRELHDRVCHDLTVVSRNLELYKLLKDTNITKAESKIANARIVTEEALKTTRELSTELRKMAVDEGLEVAISDFLRRQAPEGIKAWVSVKGSDAHISPYIRDEIFLIVREAVRNVLKHSGTSRIRAELTILPQHIRATVEDDGKGFDLQRGNQKNGTGLDSMRERATLLKGTLSVESIPDGGTIVKVSVPLHRTVA